MSAFFDESAIDLKTSIHEIAEDYFHSLQPSMTDISWFEMESFRRIRLNGAVWIPLREDFEKKEGTYGFLGYEEDIHSTVTVAIEKKTYHWLMTSPLRMFLVGWAQWLR